MPHSAAGWRIEPPVSVPIAHGALPGRHRGGRAARRAARARACVSHGFSVGP